MRLANCAGDIIVLKCTRRHKALSIPITLILRWDDHSTRPCLSGLVANMYGCRFGGPGLKSRIRPVSIIDIDFSVKIFSVVAWSWKVGGIAPPFLGEYVKQSALRINSHRSCRALVPPEYESDRNRECTCVCAYTCAL
ncbi:unnamed protein product, partial [Brenthis ino]